MNIGATHPDEMIASPPIEYEIGARRIVEEKQDHCIDGELQSVYVSYYEIEDVSLEYVVKEREWYLRYKVSVRNPESATIITEKLSANDLKPVENWE